VASEALNLGRTSNEIATEDANDHILDASDPGGKCYYQDYIVSSNRDLTSFALPLPIFPTPTIGHTQPHGSILNRTYQHYNIDWTSSRCEPTGGARAEQLKFLLEKSTV
jgi:hypothetical protein